MNQPLSSFAETIFRRTYAFNATETWDQCAKRVAKFVANNNKNDYNEYYEVISTKKFMPGGRYLYSSGREIAQTSNCFLLKAEDSREAWGNLLDIGVQALTTGGGVGVNYSNIRGRGTPIKRYGGIASGPVSLMAMVNEVARHVMAGGKRRSALWAGLNWQHPDIEEFIVVKNWATKIKAMKEEDFNFPAILDMTNISVCLDSRFFKEIKTNPDVQNFYYRICKSMCKTGEPGFSVDVGKNSNTILRNPCQPSWATILTPNGIRELGDVNVGDTIWSGKRWTIIINKWKTGIKPVYKYHTTSGKFIGTDTHRVFQKGEKVEVKDAVGLDVAIGENKFIYTTLNPQDIMDGIVIGDGAKHKASNNLVYLYVGDNDQDYFLSEVSNLFIKERPGLSKKAWEIITTITPEELPYTYDRRVPDRFFKGSDLTKLSFLRGIYTANGSIIAGKRVSLKQTSKTLIRQIQEMLSSIGIVSYITTNSPTLVRHSNGEYLSKESYDLNIQQSFAESFIERIGFIQSYKKITKHNSKKINTIKTTFDIKEIENCGFHEVFDIEVDNPEHTYWTGGVLVSNCCEVVSDRSEDVCNLGSINLAKIESMDELERVTRIGTKFLYMGTYTGWLPHEVFKEARKANRRIGLGLMGVHEWCLKNDLSYDPNGLFAEWLSIWKNVSNDEVKKVANKTGGAESEGVRAIAPTGTIGIIAETTTGIEPVFCTAYKRRFLGEDSKWQFQYVIDPTVKRLVDELGISPDDIEDTYTLATNVERRIAMQAFIQDYVDQAISSTINVPEFGEYGNSNIKKFSEILLKYLPRLRGITVYPDGARAGQPITPLKYATAIKHSGVLFQENEEKCAQGVCSI